MQITNSICQKLTKQLTSNPRMSKENIARRMMAYSYPDTFIVDYLGSEEEFNRVSNLQRSELQELISEIASQVNNSKLHQESYFDGYNAIAQVYGLDKSDVLDLRK